MDIKNTQVIFTVEQLITILREVVREEISANTDTQFLSPQDVCNMFTPAITKPTLESYSRKGIVKKYYFGGRTWFKRGEITESMKGIKRFSRDSVTNLEDSYIKEILHKKGLQSEDVSDLIVNQQRKVIKFKREIKNTYQ